MNDSLPLMIDFNAKWCGPCKLMKPIFEELAAEYDGKVNFISIDTDKFPEIAEIYRISSIPTFILVEKKSIKWGNEGSLPKTMLEEPLKAYK
jgi:thioredoxin 1